MLRFIDFLFVLIIVLLLSGLKTAVTVTSPYQYHMTLKAGAPINLVTENGGDNCSSVSTTLPFPLRSSHPFFSV